jgi:hypothetical protein
MHLKVFVKLKKTLKTLSSGQKNPKKPQKPKKPKKPKKTRVFSNPDFKWIRNQIRFRIKGLVTKNWKNTAEQLKKITFYWSKIAIYLSLGLMWLPVRYPIQSRQREAKKVEIF